MKSKKNLIILTLVIAISLIGIAYAFFDYYKLGGNQKVVAGKVNLLFNEGTNVINRSNIFPETTEKARSRTDNFITFTVSGVNTTEDQDIYYEIMLNQGDEESGMIRFNPEDLVFDLIELDDDFNEVTYLVDALSYNDFNNRRIWVNTVLRETSLTVNKTYKLRMWLSDKVLISDTSPRANYPSTGYENYYASVKVSVYGDFVEKQTPYNYMAKLGSSSTFWPSEIESVKSQITSISFISMNQNEIDTKYDDASIKVDVSDTSKGGSVKAWLENGALVTADDGTETQYYTMYVASDGTSFFPSDSSYMFSNFSKLESVSFENINTRNVTNMVCMFSSCSSLTSLDVSNFDTGSVTGMSSMFANCSSLTSLDVSNFDTGSVTGMSSMFTNCSSLTSLDVSNWDTSSVTNMEYMFRGSSKLILLDLSDWDTGSVTNMFMMFFYCSSLTTIYANNDWNTSNVTSSGGMFGCCTNLVGAIAYDSSKFDATYANPTTGYFTKKTA